MAATDTYVHLQTRRAGKLKGECIAPGHEDDIAVRGWSWGVSAQTAMGSVQATARRSYRELSFVKGADTASTGLLSALARYRSAPPAITFPLVRIRTSRQCRCWSTY